MRGGALSSYSEFFVPAFIHFRCTNVMPHKTLMFLKKMNLRAPLALGCGHAVGGDLKKWIFAYAKVQSALIPQVLSAAEA
jgi:hypothetical protein